MTRQTGARRAAFLAGASGAGLWLGSAGGSVASAAPGELRIVSAYPDPPFETTVGGRPAGFDIDLMRAIGTIVGMRCSFARYSGSDFNGIFAGLGSRYDVVISGTTITPPRERVALFSSPYALFNQGVAVNGRLHPHVRSVADLPHAVVGIQVGNTSDAVARRWLASGAIAKIAYYAYDAIETALHDLSSGKITAIVKLSPVLHALVESKPGLEVDFEVPTHERIAIAVAPANAVLCARINAALQTMRGNGALKRLQAKWFAGVVPA